MTDEELHAMLADLERTLDERVDIFRVVFRADGTMLRRIYQGSFQRPRDLKENPND